MLSCPMITFFRLQDLMSLNAFTLFWSELGMKGSAEGLKFDRYAGSGSNVEQLILEDSSITAGFVFLAMAMGNSSLS